MLKVRYVHGKALSTKKGALEPSKSNIQVKLAGSGYVTSRMLLSLDIYIQLLNWTPSKIPTLDQVVINACITVLVGHNFMSQKK